MQLPAALIDFLPGVHSVGAITGAGVSAESGIQTYRGQGGVYDDPELGDQTVEALSGEMLGIDPDLTWRTIAKMARQSRDAKPNPAHHALVEIEGKVKRFALLTQNVDPLHQQAGSKNIIPIHGDLFATRCLECNERGRLEREDFETLDAAPHCEACGGVLRPGAVLFGETLPLEEAMRMRQEFVDFIPDLVLTAGTTALFPYIQQPVLLARRAGRITVEVNPERTHLSDVVDFFLQGKAGTLLPQLADAWP
ncbi:MAG: SIR2 family NAD-dependent protein deacylase [Planctomycetota bacterium]|jgi:NAD-dependent deacetylase